MSSDPRDVVRLEKRFRVEAAHLLPKVPAGHKCRRLHGHSFRITVAVEGPISEEPGWLVDYADIATAFAPLHAALDHHYLNDVPGLDNPTSENITRWIWERLSPALPQLAEVRVDETCTSACVYRGPRR